MLMRFNPVDKRFALICLNCNKVFRTYNRKNDRNKRFCSMECFRL